MDGKCYSPERSHSSLQQQRGDTALQLRCLQAALLTSLPCVALAEADRSLLRHAVPAARQLFLQAINDITVILQGDVDIMVGDTLVRHIKVCQDVLDCLSSTTEYVVSLCSVDCILVQSVPGNVSLVLTQAFKHCRQSESLYGAMFEDMHEMLTMLFQKCSRLQSHFLTAMTSVIKFNCFFEDELVLLTEVLESMSEVGDLAAALDIKAMVDVWKGYTQLAEAYCEHLKPRLDVAKAIASLSQQVVTNLEATVCLDASEGKLMTRNIKVISFQLKVIIKLCEQYADYLGDCHEHLVVLLVSLYRLSGCGLQLMETATVITEVVDRHAGIAAEPLVAALVSDISFAQKYFEGIELKETGTGASHLGTVLLSVAVLKKLIHADNNTRKFWLNDENNIFRNVFQKVGSLHLELSWPLQIPGIMSGGEPQRMVDLYEHLLTHLAGFVMSVSVGEFPGVEGVLLENILQANAWKALLATDLWCIVARYGSADLCFQHVCQLSSVLERLPAAESRPEGVFLVSLLRRLFPLLSAKHVAVLPDVLPVPEHLGVWAVVPPALLPTRVAGQLQGHFASCVDAWLEQPLSVDLYEAVVCSLSAVAGSMTATPPDGGLVTRVVSLWHSVENAVSSLGDDALAHWLHRLMLHLCDATTALLAHINNRQLQQVLSCMRKLVSVRCSSAKLCVVMILRNLGDKYMDMDADQSAVSKLVAGLFATLLKDKNVLVSEAILEAFEYFAHVTQHAEIVAASVQDDEASQQKVAAYLQKILPNQKPVLAMKQYLSHQSQIEFVHKCCAPSVNGSIQGTQPVKKFKVDGCDDNVKKDIQQYLALSKKVVGFVLLKRVPCDERVELKKSAAEMLDACC
ncbi:FIGNL1-interacting regulator of recombination and mitosis-like isoform X2 [Bacillus rossius redtenbacheri]|uniref:FIGNL1-interacting regulator of recombination and mitosis-like isoform X2 n=1 Tax=Bacillus rossius redtenbacheri TaxID=93214 RepID=UPI002FDD0EDC